MDEKVYARHQPLKKQSVIKKVMYEKRMWQTTLLAYN